MNITVKNLRKTILLGGMSVDEAAAWCERHLELCFTSHVPEPHIVEEWFGVLIRFLMKLEGKGNLEFVYGLDETFIYSRDEIINRKYEDYVIRLVGREGLENVFYSSYSITDAEGSARDDCKILNKFLEDFFA